MLKGFNFISAKGASKGSRKKIICVRGHSSSLDQKFYWKGHSKQEESETCPNKPEKFQSYQKTSTCHLGLSGILPGHSRRKT